MPSVLKKAFSLEIVKNDICLGGASKQHAPLFKNCAPKNVAMPPMSRMGPDYTKHIIVLLIKPIALQETKPCVSADYSDCVNQRT